MSKLCDIKEKLVDIMYDVVMSDNISDICTRELYEVMDVIKDIEETKYYKSITDAMEKSEDVSKFAPDYVSRMYYDKNKNITVDSIMEEIDKFFKECSSKDECVKHRQELINYINRIQM